MLMGKSVGDHLEDWVSSCDFVVALWQVIKEDGLNTEILLD